MENFFLFFIINLIFYNLFLVIFNNLLKNQFYYPFRTLDIFNFIINIIIFGFLSLFFFNLSIFIMTIIINLNFFYILFHIQNMVNTSPRTRIIMDLYNNSNIKKYTEEKIVKNRIKRLLSNQQIILTKNRIKLNNNKNFLYFINLIFKLIKKF
jgi:hypothetical protein